jgi:hypothetical protein
LPSTLLAGTVPVSEPRADHGGQRRRVHAREGPADRGLGRHHPPVGGITTNAERGTHRLRGVRSPLSDRDHRPGAGQDRSGGHGKDRNQRMAAATAPSRVVDRGEVGEQLRRFSWSQQVGVGELGQGGWGRGCWSVGTGVHRDHEAVVTP